MTLTAAGGLSSPNYANAGALTLSNDITFTGAVTRTSQVKQFGMGIPVTASGWVVATAKNTATLAASLTSKVIVYQLVGFRVGDIITSFKVSGQIESAGGTATLDADLRTTTAAAADLTDASVGAITQISVTADTLVATTKTGLSATVATGVFYYVLITGTTAALTDIDLQGIEVTFTSN